MFCWLKDRNNLHREVHAEGIKETESEIAINEWCLHYVLCLNFLSYCI